MSPATTETQQAKNAAARSHIQDAIQVDARSIVQLMQCDQCSSLLQQPVSLPCGYAICQKCLPAKHSVTLWPRWSPVESSDHITCPYSVCRKEHPLVNCSLDITLSQVLEQIQQEISAFSLRGSDSSTSIRVAVSDNVAGDGNILNPLESHSSDFFEILGCRVTANLELVKAGKLQFNSQVEYRESSTNRHSSIEHENKLIVQITDVVKAELDCQICFGLLLDPVTTPCGHTFCRRCIVRTLDHACVCPTCRRDLPFQHGSNQDNDPAKVPANSRVSKILDVFCHDALVERSAMVKEEELGLAGNERQMPLFICSLAIPSMPTYLHVFEPRYRLMIRRAVESGGRKFGMMMYNMDGTEQGSLGRTQFMQYGTILHIKHVHMLRDGRSLIETWGMERFRVKKWGVLDGYMTGTIEVLNDVSSEVEARMMEEDMAQSRNRQNEQRFRQVQEHPIDDIDHELRSLTNLELYDLCKGFVDRMRAGSAPWLNANNASIYGLPPEDMATFPYWFASVLPIADEEKYKLLSIASIRGRLQLTADWIQRIESRPQLSQFPQAMNADLTTSV